MTRLEIAVRIVEAAILGEDFENLDAGELTELALEITEILIKKCAEASPAEPFTCLECGQVVKDPFDHHEDCEHYVPF